MAGIAEAHEEGSGWLSHSETIRLFFPSHHPISFRDSSFLKDAVTQADGLLAIPSYEDLEDSNVKEDYYPSRYHMLEVRTEGLRAQTPRFLSHLKPVADKENIFKVEGLGMRTFVVVLAATSPLRLYDGISLRGFNWAELLDVWTTAIDHELHLLATHAAHALASAEMPQMRPYEADRLLRLAEEYDHRALATKLRSAARNPPLHEILRDDPESLNAEALRRLVDAREYQLCDLYENLVISMPHDLDVPAVRELGALFGYNGENIRKMVQGWPGARRHQRSNWCSAHADVTSGSYFV